MCLTELNPKWVDYGGERIYRRDEKGELHPVPRRVGVGLVMDCPCGQCGSRCYVDFANPLDGGSPIQPNDHVWERTGETFDTLTLRPSILRARDKGGCGWHGFVTNGEVNGQVE